MLDKTEEAREIRWDLVMERVEREKQALADHLRSLREAKERMMKEKTHDEHVSPTAWLNRSTGHVITGPNLFLGFSEAKETARIGRKKVVAAGGVCSRVHKGKLGDWGFNLIDWPGN